MCNVARPGRRIRARAAIFVASSAAISAVIPALCSSAQAQVALSENSNTNWTINNGPLTVIFDPSAEDVTSIKLNSGGTSSSNLLGGSTPELDEEFAGTPFGSGPQTFNSQVGPNNSYVDVWTNVASTGTTVNPITYAFHYVLFANDPTVYTYEALSHSATDPATSVGQGQFLFRSNPSLFPNLYQINTGPNQLGTANAQTTIGIPSTNPNFSTVTAQAGRTVQNVTYDLTGSGIAGDNGTNFFTKYDYSVYSQFFQAETMYGSNYAVTEVDTAPDTLTGGLTKQELAWTDPGILNMEFLSDHYGIDGTGSGAYPGYAYYPTQGVNTSKLYGPYAFTISSTTGTTAAQINQNAINAIPNDVTEFNSDTELAAAGYVSTANRGSVQISASNAAGWSSNTANNTVVLSEPGTNFQESTQGYQYTGQISQNGTVSIPNVAPGDYRMTLYQLGQWGETRVEGVQVQSGQVTIPQGVKFTPENFGSSAPIWTIGTPNRSANEFMNGHTSTGADQREYYGAYDFWGEEQAMGTPGYVSYNATATTIAGVQQPATNNPNAWIGTQWNTFDPGIYDSSNGTDDEYTKTAPAYVTAGGGPATYRGLPWQIHFTTSAAQQAQGQYVVVSVGLVALDASLTMTLNGHSEVWSYNNFSPDDPMIRSGDSGFYQWAAFQFPTTDLSVAGLANDNEITLSVSNHQDGVMYDALRMEITNTSASPTVTGWDDYTYINGSTSVAPNDAFGIATLTWNNAGGAGNGTLWDFNNQNWNTGVAEAPFANNSNVVFSDNNNANYNVTLNSTVTPLSTLFNNSNGNYVVTGTGSISGTGSLSKYGIGTVTLGTVNKYTGGTTVNAGTLVVGVNGALPTNSAVAITGGTLQLAPSIGAVQLSSLTISGNGTFDVNNNHVLINYGSGPDPIASIAALLATGYNNGAWNGAGGIITSAPLVIGGLTYGLGYADGADPQSAATGLASSTIEIKYTLLGDADFNGIVNGIDFGILASNFNKGVTGWDEGDFDYNGIVNGLDFGDLAANFNKGAAGTDAVAALDAFAAANGWMADVPEPISGAAIILGTMAALLPRRCSRRNFATV